MLSSFLGRAPEYLIVQSLGRVTLPNNGAPASRVKCSSRRVAEAQLRAGLGPGRKKNANPLARKGRSWWCTGRGLLHCANLSLSPPPFSLSPHVLRASFFFFSSACFPSSFLCNSPNCVLLCYAVFDLELAVKQSFLLNVQNES